MTKYGLPYRGSKSRIAESILDVLPAGDRFVDLFAGGCAMTHCAMKSGWYNRFLLVDVSDVPNLFLDIVTGRFVPDPRRWVSRDEFGRLKDEDPFVRVFWSFGNNCNTYIYGRNIEPYKRACHIAIVDGEWGEFRRLCPEVARSCEDALAGLDDIEERRIALGHAITRWIRENGTEEMIDANPLYRQTRSDAARKVNHMEYHDRISRIKPPPLQHMYLANRIDARVDVRAEFARGSYESYRHEDGDVVYADPPYVTATSGATQYGYSGYDKAAFCEWVRTRDYPVFVSEYTMPGDFRDIWSADITCSYCPTTTVKSTERLYIHEKWTPYTPELKLR